jgi:hypothetical protein
MLICIFSTTRKRHACMCSCRDEVFVAGRLRITSKSGSSFWPRLVSLAFALADHRPAFRESWSAGPSTIDFHGSSYYNIPSTTTSLSPDALLVKPVPHHGSTVRAACASSRADSVLSLWQACHFCQQRPSNDLSEPTQHTVALRSHLDRTRLAPLSAQRLIWESYKTYYPRSAKRLDN